MGTIRYAAFLVSGAVGISLLSSGIASAAPTAAPAAAENCFVNGERQPGPEIEGTNGDDDIACDVLASGDVIHGYGGNDSIQVTRSDYGIVNGEDGDDHVVVHTNRGGLVQGGAGVDRIEVRENARSDGSQSRIRGDQGDDNITAQQNFGIVEGNDGFDTCSVFTGNPPSCEAR